jgi:2-amino-4-hydroxy-6-hydroxymethyldihydropteridine diphosphokinase
MIDVAYIALGSNVGDRRRYLARAREAIARLPDTTLVGASAELQTAPLGPVPQGAYLNQMLAVETALPPAALLERLLAIEAAEGRERTVRWGPRTLDLDIVLFERQSVREPGLVVPHPELPNREFWQQGLAELRAALSAGGAGESAPP